MISAQRAQVLHLLNIKDLIICEKFSIFLINGLVEQSSQRKKNAPVVLKSYEDPALCVVNNFKEYLRRTMSKRNGEKQLFISFYKAHKAVSKDTISRWIRCVLREAGVNTEAYKPHSTRSASTAAAKRNCVPVEQIIHIAGWANSRMFARYYDKQI